MRDHSSVGGGCRIDAPARGQNLGGELDGVGEVAGDFAERSDEEVPKAMAAESGPRSEAVGKEFRKEVLFRAESDHAVANVAGREHVEVLAKPAGGSAVISYGDDGREIRDVARVRCRPVWICYVLAETAEKSGETCPATNSDDTEARRGSCGLLPESVGRSRED
jgi:hypothetical protein